MTPWWKNTIEEINTFNLYNIIILVDLLAEDNYFRDNKCYHNSKHISRQPVSNCIADIYHLELRKKQQIKQGDKVIDNQHYFIDFSWILFK